ncbi:MAG: tetratricopeptide repeat protein [Myxococcales bacterium]|nr:tetratricopeptide repeat protein [Myxococcales bacterium]
MIARLTAFTLVLVSLSSLAAAQSEGEPVRDEEARRLFQAGELAFDDARYDEALDLFQRSYRLSGRPALLFNIGQAADRIRRDEVALEAFERYLELRPDAPNRRQVEVRVEALQRTVAERRAAAANAEQRERRPLDLSAPTSEEPRAEAPRRRTWVWAVVGAVVAVAAVGLVVGLTYGRTQDPLPGDVGPGGVVFALR